VALRQQSHLGCKQQSASFDVCSGNSHSGIAISYFSGQTYLNAALS